MFVPPKRQLPGIPKQSIVTKIPSLSFGGYWSFSYLSIQTSTVFSIFISRVLTIDYLHETYRAPKAYQSNKDYQPRYVMYEFWLPLKMFPRL